MLSDLSLEQLLNVPVVSTSRYVQRSSDAPAAPAVIAAYRARGLVPLRHLRIEGWSSLLLRKAG